MAAEHSSKRVIYAALAGNVLVALTKLVAAAVSGSSSMLSEAIHSVVDTLNEVLLLYGMRRSKRAPDAAHPLGYGRELYFWSFVVAVLLFGLGAGLSVYQGILRILTPRSVESARVIYIVLALSFCFEGYSWLVARREFKAAKGDLSYWEAVRKSKDPLSFMVLFEDSAALIGICIVALGTLGTEYLHMPVLDGVASILIGGVLAFTASILARECKGLLIGEQTHPAVAAAIKAMAERDPCHARANGIFTVQLAPTQIIVVLSLEFSDELRVPEIEESIAVLENEIRAAYPQVVALFVKPQTRNNYETREKSKNLQ